MKKGFIFDLDGVVVDTAQFHFLAWKNAGQEFGFELTHELNEQLKGVSRVNSLKKILEWAETSISQEDFDRIMQEKNEDYLTYVTKMTKADILPGVEAFIQELKSHRYPVALGSASKNARGILERVGLLSQFDTIVDGTNVSKAKPDPEVFLVGAKQLGVDPENCIVFEDAVAGVTAANAANMTSVGIGSPNHLGHAKFVFKNFTEFPADFITQLNKE